MDSQSDMESEDNDVLPDSDDFVIKNSSEAMLDEPVVFCCCCENGLESVCLINYPPFQLGRFFVTKTTAYSLLQKQT